MQASWADLPYPTSYNNINASRRLPLDCDDDHVFGPSSVYADACGHDAWAPALFGDTTLLAEIHSQCWPGSPTAAQGEVGIYGLGLGIQQAPTVSKDPSIVHNDDACNKKTANNSTIYMNMSNGIANLGKGPEESNDMHPLSPIPQKEGHLGTSAAPSSGQTTSGEQPVPALTLQQLESVIDDWTTRTCDSQPSTKLAGKREETQLVAAKSEGNNGLMITSGRRVSQDAAAPQVALQRPDAVNKEENEATPVRVSNERRVRDGSSRDVDTPSSAIVSSRLRPRNSLKRRFGNAESDSDDFMTYEDDMDEPETKAMRGRGGGHKNNASSRRQEARQARSASSIGATASKRPRRDQGATNSSHRNTVPASRSLSELKGRPSFAALVHAGYLTPGAHGFQVGNSEVLAEIESDGAINYGGSTYRAISKFALVVLRERNPARQSCDGWKEVTWNGVKLDTLRTRMQQTTQ